MRPEDHQWAEPDVGVEPEAEDQHDRRRKEQIGRKRSEELHNRLRRVGEAGMQADPYADRHPDGEASRISTKTRNAVIRPSTNTHPISAAGTLAPMNAKEPQPAGEPQPSSARSNSRSKLGDDAVEICLAGSRARHPAQGDINGGAGRAPEPLDEVEHPRPLHCDQKPGAKIILVTG